MTDGRIQSADDLLDARFETRVFGTDARTDFSLDELARLYQCSPMQVTELYAICHRRGALRWNAEHGVMEELQPVQIYLGDAVNEFRQFLAHANTSD